MFPRFLISVHDTKSGAFLQLQQDLVKEGKKEVLFRYSFASEVLINLDALADEIFTKLPGFTQIEDLSQLGRRITLERMMNLRHESLVDKVTFLKEIAGAYESVLIEIELV